MTARTAEPTPLPAWAQRIHDDADRLGLDGEARQVAIDDYADRAVNSHAALVEALSKAYTALCALSATQHVFIQAELCACRDTIAAATGRDAEEVQNEHESAAMGHKLRTALSTARDTGSDGSDGSEGDSGGAP